MKKGKTILVNIILTMSTIAAALSYFWIVLWGGKSALLIVPAWIVVVQCHTVTLGTEIGDDDVLRHHRGHTRQKKHQSEYVFHILLLTRNI